MDWFYDTHTKQEKMFIKSRNTYRMLFETRTLVIQRSKDLISTYVYYISLVGLDKEIFPTESSITQENAN